MYLDDDLSKQMERMKLMLQERVQHLIVCIDRNVEHQDNDSALDFRIALEDIKTILNELNPFTLN